jgi:hypothetical protein
VYLEAVSRLAKSIPNSIFKVTFGIDMVLDIEYADDYDEPLPNIQLKQVKSNLQIASLTQV